MKKTLTLILLYSVFITFISPFTTARASSDKFQSKLSTAGSSNRSINKSSNQANSQTSDSEDDSGLVYKLSEQNTRPPEPAGKPQIEMLDPVRTEQLVSLLPDIGSEGELQSDFKLSNATIPPPKTGERLPIINPGEMISPPDVNTNTKLEIVRFAPSGEVGKAAELTVTFSDPMVSITSQDQALENIPVELSPKVEGGWRWLGTKTLLFAAKPRFPMATEYTLRIPAGTRSANGAILDKDFVWNFTTPPVGIENKYPTGEGIKLDPVILIKFDQAISQTALLPYIKIIANGKEIPFRLAADDEIMADEETKGLVNSYKESSQQSTYIAIRPIDQSGNTADALPKNSLVTVRLLAGAPSQEGPLTTKTVQEFSFKTYKDFQFEELNCKKNQDGTCSPESGAQLIFSNPLALQEFKPEYVKIEPSVEEVNIHASGSVINLNGPFQGKTRYKISVDGRLKDDFGQQLGKEITAEFITGNLQPGLYDTGEVFQVLDPFYPPKVSFYSVNIPVFRVRIYRVRPVDYPSFLDVVKKVFQQSQQKKNSKEKEEIAFPGKLVSDLKISSDQADNKYIREDIELSKFLDNNRGHLLVYVEPVFEDSLPSEYPNQTFPQIAPILKWVQATQIGLSALSDYEQLSIYASDIKTGKALADVQIELYPKAGLSALAYPADKSISLNQTLFEKINWMFGPQAADPIESYFLNRQDSKRNTDKEFPSTTENSEKLEKGQHTESGWERESEDIYSFAAATGRDGMAKLALPERAGGNEKGNFNYLVASLGNDTAILTRESSYRGVNPDSGWFKTPQNDELRWYVFDDRGIYKPGEEAAIKGYIRIWQAGKYGDIKALDGSFRQIKWQFVDDDGNELLKGTTAINNYGGFDLKFRLPQGINLDTYRLVLSVENQIANNQFEHNIRVDEFRRPDFEVKTALQTAGPVIVGNEVTLSADAKYFSGGALPNAPVNWQTSARVTDYNPPGHDGYHFGRWSWWFSYYDEEDNFSSEGEFTSKTDKQGRHLLNVAFNDAEPAFAYNFYAAVTVSDVNRQTYGSGTSFIVHPAELYVGLKSSKSFVSKGEKFTVQSIATDIDGKLAEGRKVKLTAELLENKYIDGEWQETVTDTQNCEVTSAVSPQNCTFEARRPGSYKVTASILDDRERLSQTEIRVIVTGGGNWFRQDSSGERLTLVPDKESYAPGETARILINSPFENAEGTLTISRGGILTSQHIVVSGGSAELPVKIEEKFIPEVKLFVNLYSTEPRDVNAAPEQSEPAKPKPRPISPAKSSNSKKSQSPAGRQNENLPPKPAMVSNEITLGVSTASRTLSVEILPEKTFTEPGAETQISFMVKDSVGRPVPQAEVALVVADEAIMSLVNYNVPSPIEAFYKALDSSLEREESRNYVNLASSNPVFVKSTYYKYGFLYRAVLDST
ncbi:MAG TPA: MG2 domain-containing protein, partial [Pyrinomonadaceae bacterium]|nr:MG2 domain-containing protein [Pyrinomonadaceae bacterium]